MRSGPARLAGQLIARLPVMAVLAAVTLFVMDPAPLVSIRNQFFDQLQRWHPRQQAASPITVVDIDEQSVARLGQWPWPRSRLARLVERLEAAGAQAIGFDMTFPEPDRTSPRALLEERPGDDALAQALSRLPDHDRLFASRIASAKVVLGFALQNLPQTTRPLPAGFVQAAGSRPTAFLHAFGGRLGSLPELEAAAAGLGHFSVLDFADGIVRRVPLLVTIDGQPAPALTLEMLRVGTGGGAFRLDSGGAEAGLAGITVGQRRVRTSAEGESWVHYSPLRHGAYLPAWQVLENDAPPHGLAGHFILIGSSASLMHDSRLTPLGEWVPGVEVHRQLLEQLLGGHAIERPAWAAPAEFLALLAGCMLAAWIGARPLTKSRGVVLAVLPVAAIGLASESFARHGLLVDPLTPIMGWLLCLVTASLVRLYLTERRQRWIRAAFSRYVSPNLVHHLVEHPEAIELGGARRQCSFVFTDLQGFTHLIEQTPPKEAVALINAYLDGMIAIVFRHDGTILRIVGDALAVMFSAPIEQRDHAQRAFDCALALDDFACAFIAARQAVGADFCKTRIGVHSGEVTVGNFGGSAMLEYRALGDPVNVAARLEAANKALGSRVCVSSATLDGCDVKHPVRPVGRVLLRGKREAVEVFEPLPAPDHDYQAAFELLRGGAPGAQAAFAALAAQRPDDPLVAFHLGRLKAGQRGADLALA